VVGVHRACVVDPAPSDPEVQLILLQHLKDLHARGVELTALVLTHHHHDHMGAAAFLRRETGLPIWAHAVTGTLLDFPIQHTLADGDPLPCDGPSWRAVFTPGHAAGHLCFLRETDQALICGDMMAGYGSILVYPDEGSMRLYLQSLERLLALSPSVVFPAHGPEMKPGAEAVAGYLAHRRARSDAVLQRVREGDTTPLQMVPHIYAGTPEPMFPLAARSVLAMLIQHEEEGRVHQRNGCWIPST